MKRLLIVGLTLCAFSSFAQTRKVTFGASFGAGSGTILNSLEYTSRAAFRVGGSCEYNFWKALNLQVDPSFNYYSIKNENYFTDQLGNSTNYKLTSTFFSIDVPVLIKGKIPGEFIKPYYAFGFGPSFLLNSKSTSSSPKIPGGSLYGIPVDEGFSSVYGSIYNVVGLELKGETVFPYIEFRALHSVTKTNEYTQYANINIYTFNLGMRF